MNGLTPIPSLRFEITSLALGSKSPKQSKNTVIPIKFYNFLNYLSKSMLLNELWNFTPLGKIQN